jgi:acyl-CoA synthetase (AMP-forming)/AMP-acid ligase II
MSMLNTEQLDAVQTLGDIARLHARVRPNAIATSFEGRTTTYAEFNANTNRIAHALQAAGVSKDDRIGYLAKNTDCYFEILLGGAKMGAVTLPIGWRLAPAEISYLLENGEVSILFVGAEFTDLAQRAIELSGRQVRVIALQSASDEGFAAWRDSHSAEDPRIDIQPSDTALQLYTSGTTGRPKGVMLTNANLLKMWIRASQAEIDCYRWTEDDVCLVAMPLAHIGGTGWGIVGLLNGASLIVLPEFDPPTILGLIGSERITKLFIVPSALNFLIQMPGARDVDYSRLKIIFYGASPIPLDLLRQCMDMFGCGFCQQYGMTEACGTIVYLPPEDHDPDGNRRMRSAGRPMPGIEIKIIDKDGITLPPEAVGEIATRSTSNMAGYWKNEAATQETIDADGWLRTGDAGYLDSDGYLYIHDRVKDMIISGAENIYPAEVEGAIFGHPAVAEVAVIGVPDERWGEAVKAVVVLKRGIDADEADILQFARTRIAAFKVPKSVDFVDVLPRNASGKVLKRSLREPYWAGKDRNVN